MASITWRVEFSSAKLLPELPEDCQSNPGVYGFELAWWLAKQLAKRGAVTSYPLQEDWGWLLEYSSPNGVDFTIGCSSIADENEGYSGAPILWSILISPHVSLKHRLLGGSHVEDSNFLESHILSALVDEGISVEMRDA